MSKKRNFYIEPEDYNLLRIMGYGNASAGLREALAPFKAGVVPMPKNEPIVDLRPTDGPGRPRK